MKKMSNLTVTSLDGESHIQNQLNCLLVPTAFTDVTVDVFVVYLDCCGLVVCSL